MTDDVPADRQIVVSRLFDPPRERVFAAWAEPRHIQAWWGPDGFTNTISSMELRPGGVWRFVMHGPDGTDYPNRIVFTEVTRPARLVYEHGDDKEPFEASFHAIVTFDDEHGKTRLTLRLVFDSAAACDRVKAFGAEDGGRQTLARLDRYLSTANL
ncbi:MAG: SRPBCC family protein [Rhodocyclaceae bacterium]